MASLLKFNAGVDNSKKVDNISFLACLAEKLSTLQITLRKNYDPSVIGKLNKLENLYIRQGTKISGADFSWLSQLTQLQYLNCSETDLDTLSSLHATKLKSLDVSGCKNLTSLDGIENCKDLESLAAQMIPIDTLKPISGFTQLKSVWIRGTKVEDLAPLSQSTDLEILYAEKTKIKSLDGIQDLKKLQLLWIFDTKVNDISPISGFKNLKELNLSDLKISDYSPLATLTNLEELDLYGSNFSDAALLQKLPRLKKARLEKTPIENEKIVYHSEDGKGGSLLKYRAPSAGALHAITLSPDGETLAIGKTAKAGSAIVTLVELKTGTFIKDIETATNDDDFAFQVIFAKGGGTLYYMIYRQNQYHVIEFSIATGNKKTLYSVDTRDRYYGRSFISSGLSYDPIEDRLLISTETAVLIDCESGKAVDEFFSLLQKSTTSDYPDYRAVFSPDGSIIAAGGFKDTVVALYDTKDFSLLKEVETGCLTPVVMKINSDNSKMLIISDSRKLYKVDLHSGSATHAPLSGSTTCCAFSPDGSRFAEGIMHGSVFDRAFEEDYGNSDKNHLKGVTDVLFTGDGRHLVSSSLDSV